MKKIWVSLVGLVVIAGIIGGAGSRQIVKAEEENLEADNSMLFLDFGDISECLNVIDKKEEKGIIIEVSFFCNEDKNLTIDDSEKINSFINNYSWAWESRILDYYNLDGTYFDKFNLTLEKIESGKLLLLERDSNHNITYFAIGDETEDGEKYLVSGDYDAEDLGYSEEVFVLGAYMINNPEEWQKKLDWNYSESKKWLFEGHSDILLEKPEAYDKWVYSYGSNDELFETGIIPFKDVPQNEWYTGWISYLKDLGIVSGDKDANGNPTGYFRPEDSVTVAEFIKMTLNAAGIGEKIGQAPAEYWNNEEVNAISSDGNENHWALKFYKIAKYLKTRLVSEMDFNLNRPIKRKEVVGLMRDVAGDNLIEDEDNKSIICFDDLEPNDKYSSDICFFKQIELIEGYDDGSFKGDNGINRAEAAKMIVGVSDIAGDPIEYGVGGNNACTDTCEEYVLLTEFLKNLIEKAGVPINTEGSPVFENVEQSHKNYPYAATAFNAGLVFLDIGVYDNLGREQAARIIVELLQLEGGEDIELTFQDVLEDAWYAEYIKTLVANGIIENGGEVFMPGRMLSESDAEDWLSNI